LADPRIEVVPATDEYGRAVAATMRASDIAEVWALDRHSPAEAIQRSLDMPGEAYAFLVDDVPLAVFGCAETVLPGVASPWLLGAEGVEHHARQFLELGREYVYRWGLEYEHLYNVVDARNGRSIDWLGRLGFTFADPILIGPDAMPFLPFHLRLSKDV
jgi:hypothetical protein